jgi:probable rRNA maturation factor
MSACMATENCALEIDISDTQGHLAVDPERVRGLVHRVLAAEAVGRAAISVALVDDATIHAVNRRHLRHDWPTDVISFVHSDPGAPVLEGEVVISAERAAALAGRLGADAWAELALYLVHGLLHLCGYDDREERERARMRQREDELLQGAGLTNTFPLAERAAARRGGGERESVRCSDWT